jgi:hypothetical protein
LSTRAVNIDSTLSSSEADAKQEAVAQATQIQTKTNPFLHSRTLNVLILENPTRTRAHTKDLIRVDEKTESIYSFIYGSVALMVEAVDKQKVLILHKLLILTFYFTFNFFLWISLSLHESSNVP